MSNKYYMSVHGALGDTILHMFRHNSIFRYVEPFKKAHPSKILRVVCCSSNSQSSELFRENPYIDEVQHVPWQDGMLAKLHSFVGDYRGIDLNSTVLKGLTPVPMHLYLNPEDEKLVKSIIGSKRFILIHPFGSQKSYEILSPDQYLTVIDKLIDDLGYSVVTVGGSYKKTFKQGDSFKKEELLYERPGLFNLVNKANVRVAVRLAREAYGYLGTWSAFFCATVGCSMGPAVFTTEKHAVTIDRVNPVRFRGIKYHKIYVGGAYDLDKILHQVDRIF